MRSDRLFLFGRLLKSILICASLYPYTRLIDSTCRCRNSWVVARDLVLRRQRKRGGESILIILGIDDRVRVLIEEDNLDAYIIPRSKKHQLDGLYKINCGMDLPHVSREGGTCTQQACRGFEYQQTVFNIEAQT